MTDHNMCPRCEGSGGGDYPMHCPTCGGSGEVRRVSGYDYADAEQHDYTDEPCDAEVRW
jgi:DnaJ-class molecular chaperone